MTNITLSLYPLTKIPNDHHLLNFYLSESCKNPNNSQLYCILLSDFERNFQQRVFYPTLYILLPAVASNHNLIYLVCLVLFEFSLIHPSPCYLVIMMALQSSLFEVVKCMILELIHFRIFKVYSKVFTMAKPESLCTFLVQSI